MTIRCSKSSKVKERRSAPPTITETRKAELHKRREKELRKGPLPVVDTRRHAGPSASRSPSTLNSLTETTHNFPDSATNSPIVLVEPQPSSTHIEDTVNTPPDLSHLNGLLMSSSTFMCCSVRVADQPEDAGYYIYPVALTMDEAESQKVKLCSTEPPQRKKPLEVHRPAPIFVPYSE